MYLYGTYSFTIGSIAGFAASPSSGSVKVNGTSQTLTIQFSASSSTAYYTVDFTETGLASGSAWAVTLGGAARAANASTIGFTEPNGTYSFAADCGANYTTSPASGTLNVSGSIVARSIVCQNATGGFAPLLKMAFEAAGLPGSLHWTVTLTPDSPGLTILTTVSVSRSAAGDQPITFQATRGTYAYTATASGFGTQSGTINVGGVSASTLTVSFLPAQGSSTTTGPLALPEVWAFGVAIFAIGAVGLGATVYRTRARRAERGRDLVRGIAEVDWANDGSGEPVPRMNR